ncbi:MAG: exostosin domain-containing protein [Chitinophagaceae bacterium]
MTIYIPDMHQGQCHEKELFLFTRPFWQNNAWCDSSELKMKWGLNPSDFTLCDSPEKADAIFFPRTINYYFKKGYWALLETMNALCAQRNIKGYAYIAGDFGEKFPPLSHIIYFRMGGFRNQLDANNRSFPSSLSDHMIRLFKTNDIATVPYQERPVVGFCGQATLSKSKAFKEHIKFLKENWRRFIKNPFRTDYEPLFASGFERAQLLKSLEANTQIDTRFIYREHYRGGANTAEEREKTTLEYYENLRESQYVVCIRGGGNFSVRFYQTLLMGRIPVFVNTNCLLPFEDQIPWKQHVVWVEWHEREKIAEKILQFHQQHTPESLKALQEANRSIWLNDLSLPGMLRKIASNS